MRHYLILLIALVLLSSCKNTIKEASENSCSKAQAGEFIGQLHFVFNGLGMAPGNYPEETSVKLISEFGCEHQVLAHEKSDDRTLRAYSLALQDENFKFKDVNKLLDLILNHPKATYQSMLEALQAIEKQAGRVSGLYAKLHKILMYKSGSSQKRTTWYVARSVGRIRKRLKDDEIKKLVGLILKDGTRRSMNLTALAESLVRTSYSQEIKNVFYDEILGEKDIPPYILSMIEMDRLLAAGAALKGLVEKIKKAGNEDMLAGYVVAIINNPSRLPQSGTLVENIYMHKKAKRKTFVFIVSALFEMERPDPVYFPVLDKIFKRPVLNTFNLGRIVVIMARLGSEIRDMDGRLMRLLNHQPTVQDYTLVHIAKAISLSKHKIKGASDILLKLLIYKYTSLETYYETAKTVEKINYPLDKADKILKTIMNNRETGVHTIYKVVDAVNGYKFKFKDKNGLMILADQKLKAHGFTRDDLVGSYGHKAGKEKK